MRTEIGVLVIAGILLALALHSNASTATVTAPGGDVRVVVADSPQERQDGLMNEARVPLDGMLFVFPEAGTQVFWMKDTSIPLDIVFIGEDGTVLNVETANPEPGIPPEELTRYRSTGPAKYALEVPQGDAAELGLSPGAEVAIRQTLFPW